MIDKPRTTLDVQFVGRVNADAMRAIGEVKERRKWGDSKSGSPLTTNMLCAEIARLHMWIADLQSGMYVNCVYCGHRYGPGETTPVSMADALKAHIAQCPAHPMSELIKVLTAASHALKSYAYGNAAPDLAQSVAKQVDAALAKVKAAAS